MLGSLVHLFRVAQSKLREKHKSATRSVHWDETRDAFLKANPFCAACTGKANLQVHHKKPFHLHPELELEPKNLIVLCMGPNDCHLHIGHGGNFQCWNPMVEEHAALVKAVSVQRPLIEQQAKQVRRKQD